MGFLEFADWIALLAVAAWRQREREEMNSLTQCVTVKDIQYIIKSLTAATIDVNDYVYSPGHQKIFQVKRHVVLKPEDKFPDTKALIWLSYGHWVEVEYNELCREIEEARDRMVQAVTQ
jgi:hypothetical protein